VAHVHGLVNAARDGYLFFLERSNGPIRFVDAGPYVPPASFDEHRSGNKL